MIEATNHILELSGRLCELEKSLGELRMRESKALREIEEQKHSFRESRHENTQLKGKTGLVYDLSFAFIYLT